MSEDATADASSADFEKETETRWMRRENLAMMNETTTESIRQHLYLGWTAN